MVDKPQANSEPKIEDDNSDFVTREELIQIVNSAISSRTKSWERKMDEFIAKASPSVESEPKDDPKKPSLNKLQEQLNKITAERDAEVAKRKDTDLRNMLRDNLTKAGVPAHLMKAAMAVLISEDKVVGYNEDNQMVFKSAAGEEMELATGLKTFFKSEEGKAFLPPKGATGSGDKAYSPSSSKPSPTMTDTDIADTLSQAIRGY